MITKPQWHLLDKETPYFGPELRPHWILETTGIYGSAIVGFQGPCHVKTEKLVDWEDRLAQDSIQARSMLHFVGEFFGISLESGVFAQRLFMQWAQKLLSLRPLIDQKTKVIYCIERRGDDLYLVPQGGDAHPERKLSVSIATASSVSVLIHWGINIDSTGAPSTVKAGGLQDFGWSRDMILDFAKELLTQYIEELEEIRIAQCKVRPVS